MRNLIVRGGRMSAAFFMATTVVAVDAMTAPVDAGTSGFRSGSDTIVLADRRRPSADRRRVRYRTSRSAGRSRFRVAAALPDSPDVWARLRHCESRGRYDINTGNGYFGAYQFAARTWRNLGFPGLPHEASPEMQDEAARRLQARSGWGQWPACARRLGLR
jgi:hypothetical protein